MAHFRFFRPVALWVTALLMASIGIRPAFPAEVWVGGSRAWPDFIAPEKAGQWSFLQKNADGFYINNFAMRLTDATLALDKTQEGREAQLRQVNALFKNKKLIYETDQEHSSDEFDEAALKAFVRNGFQVMGSTINRGTNPARTAILTHNGQLPLYYMFGPWHGGGDIQNAENADLRTQMAKTAGGAVDGPVTMWRKDAGKMKAMCYSTIRWTHAHGQKFLYLLAPNESGQGFLEESQKLVHDMEDNEANPDIWAVSFYGPPAFRATLETLPEKDEKGAAAATFSGAAYWLIHHLRDPESQLKFTMPLQNGAVLKNEAVTLNSRTSKSFKVDLRNSSTWLDLAPLVRARVQGDGKGWTLKWLLGERDVTPEISGQGLAFIKELRLQPQDSRQLVLQAEHNEGAQPVEIRLEMLSHPSETVVKKTLQLKVF